MIQEIKSLALQIEQEIISYRRYFHKHPELSLKEENTSKYICDLLDKWGVEYKSGIAKNGILAKIKGKEIGKTIALRADMDALPIKEVNNADYCSVNEGVMHACGHDAHMASLLGTVKILNQLKDKIRGTILIVFQPSEETYPGGAKMMLEEGVFEEYNISSFFGQHTMPEMQSGTIGFKSGKYMASTDEIFLKVIGKGGHAAQPNQNIDTILLAAQILVQLQQLVSRNAPPSIPTVLSFGRIIGEGRTNIIPDEVTIDGTIRTFDEQWRAQAHDLIKRIAEHTALAAGGKCIVDIHKGYPYVENNHELTLFAKEAAIEYLGKENVLDLELRMTAEDFSYYAQKFPAVFYRFGTSNKSKGINFNLHTNTFDIDEDCLVHSVGFMAYLAIKSLS